MTIHIVSSVAELSWFIDADDLFNIRIHTVHVPIQSRKTLRQFLDNECDSNVILCHLKKETHNDFGGINIASVFYTGWGIIFENPEDETRFNLQWSEHFEEWNHELAIGVVDAVYKLTK